MNERTIPIAGAFDLTDQAFTPPGLPEWVTSPVPAWVRPYIGKNGTPPPWNNADKPFGSKTGGVDRYLANHFIWYRPETADFLYREYTPLAVDYRAGTLPAYEKAAACHTAGCGTDTEKATVLLTQALPEIMPHPTIPPTGPWVPGNRNLDDEALLACGSGWCNEQARIFIRLCQVCNIPARLIHLFGRQHTAAEFFADGRWALADVSYFFVVPDSDGRLLSVAQCHDHGAGQSCYSEAYDRRIQALLAMSDAELFPGQPAEVAAKFRREAGEVTPRHLVKADMLFGVINVPLPPAPGTA